LQNPELAKKEDNEFDGQSNEKGVADSKLVPIGIDPNEHYIFSSYSKWR